MCYRAGSRVGGAGDQGDRGFRVISTAGAPSDVAPSFFALRKKTVGAVSLANAGYKSTFYRLIHRIREQARSHI